MRLRLPYANISLFAALLTINLATGWLLPNHYPPWLAFHSNAWVGLALLLMALRSLTLVKAPVAVEASGLFLLAVAAIPLLQHAGGLLPLASDAVVRALCLFGAAIAYLLARHWSAAQPLEPASGVLKAMLIAAVVSVGIATYQWLGLAQDLALTDIWVLPFAEGTRPYANMGQPNQLASLLLCGLLGVGWAWRQRTIGTAVALFTAAWICWGVALTESRTALLTFGLAAVALTAAKPRYLSRLEIRSVQWLFVFYLVCLIGKASLARALDLDMPLSVLERSASELRLSLWKMSLDASFQSPWLGFGWGRANAGYFLVLEKYRQSLGNTYFEQSHNLILDLALWAGWPFAILCVVLGGIWLIRVLKNTRNAETLIVFMAMMVLLIHAMLEFPLHYGYFLWPFFMLAGAISGNLNWRWEAPLKVANLWARTVIVGMIATTVVMVVDYLKVESAFNELRFQVARIGSGHDETLPDVLILRDWPDAIALTRKMPHAGMSEQEIRHWEALMMYNTSPLALRKVIGAYKLNGKEDEAKAWANRVCWLLSEKACKGLYDEWVIPADSSAPLSQPPR